MTEPETATIPQDTPTAGEVTPLSPDEATRQGIVVTVDKMVWGYRVHLNQKAVDLLDVCLTVLEEALTRCFKGEIRRAISICIQVKQHRLQAVSARNDYKGCQLVSPWICPFALTVVREKTAEPDLGLYSAVWDSATGQWSEETAFTDITSATGPALAQHGDRLFCVYRGSAEDQRLYWMVYTSDKGWTDGDPNPPRAFPAHWTTGVPTLVEFKDELYCFHKGGGTDNGLYFCKFDDKADDWTPDKQIITTGGNVAFSWNGVAAAVMGDRLHLVYRHTDDNSSLYQISTLDCQTWEPYPMGGESQDTPALAVFNDELRAIFRGKANTDVHHGHSKDAKSWSRYDSIPGYHSNQGPAVAVHDGKMYLIARANDKTGDLWYAIDNGSAWSNDVRLPDHHTGDNPAAVVYKDPASNTANYEDPSTTGTRLILVYRGN